MFNPSFTPENINSITLESYLETSNKIAFIDKDNLEDELVHLPVIYSYYHGLMIRSKRAYDRAINAFEQEKACIKLKLRQESATKVPVDALENKALCDQGLIALSDDVLKYDEIYGFYKGLCQTLGIKKEMLVQINADKRAETKLYN